MKAGDLVANKRYYWIKLKTDFFNIAEIDFLLGQENGCQYVILYQMLCLLTANNGGLLATEIDGRLIPFDVDKICRDTKYFSRDTVLVGLDWFKKLKLIYIDENNCSKITSFDTMVGSETTKASIMRNKRARQKELASGNNVTKMLPQCSEQCYVDIEKELDKEIDIDKRVRFNMNNLTNYFRKISLVQDDTTNYNSYFEDKNIYMDSPANLPENILTQLKLYQLAIKHLVDNNQLGHLDNIHLSNLQKAFDNMMKATNVSNWLEYYLAILTK